MRSPNPIEVEAFQRMASRPEGQLYRAYLEECLKWANEAMAQTVEDTLLRQIQGQARLLRALLIVWKP